MLNRVINKKFKYIIFFLPNLDGGGAEKVIIDIANSLHQRGYCIELLVSKKNGIYLDRVNKNIPIVDLQSKKVIFAIFKLFKYIKQKKPDILFSTHLHTSFISSICVILNFFKTKLYLREAVNPNIKYSNNILINYLRKFIFVFNLCIANKIIIPSIEMNNDLKKEFSFIKKKFNHIYNPIDLNKIYQLSLNSEKPFCAEDYIISVARLEKQKDFITLLKAFKIISNKFKTNLLILGEGSNRDMLTKFIYSQNLEKRVFMPGFLKNPFFYISKAKIFVHSSFAEGLPNSLLQAVILNKYVISTDCDYGPKEIINGSGYGKLVPIGDYNMMAKMIEQALLHTPSTKKNYDFIEKFNIEKIINEYEILFSQ